MYSYKVCCIFISAWALVLLFQRSWAMREPLIAGMSNVYSSRAFFMPFPEIIIRLSGELQAQDV